jgi:hypothetical protein
MRIVNLRPAWTKVVRPCLRLKEKMKKKKRRRKRAGRLAKWQSTCQHA